MTDRFSVAERSYLMSRVKNKNTAGEIAVRKIVYGMGYRYRLHGRALPGSPDIVFKKRNKVIFVHGCFWHGHPGCSRAKLPNSKRDFWRAKIVKNRQRDTAVIEELTTLGYSALVVWTCEIKKKSDLPGRLAAFLGDLNDGA